MRTVRGDILDFKDMTTLDMMSICGKISNSFEGHDHPGNDVHTLGELVLCDAEWWSKADDVSVGGLSQQSIVPQFQADIPGVMTWRGEE